MTDEGRQPDAARRKFLRGLAHDAATSAGWVAGASSVMRRSLQAAGDSTMRELAPPPEGGAPEEAGAPGSSDPSVPDATSTAVAQDGPPAPAPSPAEALGDARPRPVISAEQDGRLRRATHAVFAVNRADGPPLVTSGPIHWDGVRLRSPGRQPSLRVTSVTRDPRVTVRLEFDDGASATIAGRARVVLDDPDGWLRMAEREGSPVADAPIPRDPAAVMIWIDPESILWSPGV